VITALASLLVGLSFNCSYVPPPNMLADIAGSYTYQTHTISVTPATCRDALLLSKGYTWQRGYAAFTIAHELGHASGLIGEPEADCYGARHASAVAYLLGLHRDGLRARSRVDGSRFFAPGTNLYALLYSDGVRVWGYSPIPKECFP
jgi:hypothetical protein